LSPGRREGWWEDILRFGFIPYYPTLTSDCQQIKLISLIQDWFARDGNCRVISLCPYLNP